MKVAIYARVSTADGRQDADNQLAELRRFAATQGWEVTGEYVDHESGSRADRAEFKRLFRAASRRIFDVILFWALDRFTREGSFANAPAPQHSDQLRRRLQVVHRNLSGFMRDFQRGGDSNSWRRRQTGES